MIRGYKRICRIGSALLVLLLAVGCGIVSQAEETRAIPVDDVHFPDAVFREYVSTYLAGEDAILSGKECDTVVRLEFYYEDIKTLKGIEYFPNLQYLYCEGNRLSSLDLRSMTNLKEIECADNDLTSLWVSGLPKLTRLACSDNLLKELDLQQLPSLRELECGCNKLSSLKVQGLPALEYLVCNANRIENLELSGLEYLRNVDCEGNKMKKLTLGSLPNLSVLLCGTNRLTALDVSGLPALRTLYCYQNKLGGLDCSANAALDELEAFDNRMVFLNLKGLSHLRSVNCNDNRVAVLDVSSAAGLQILKAERNCLAALDLSANKSLTAESVSLTGQEVKVKAVQERKSCKADLSRGGFRKGRVKNLSSGKKYKKGIYWKSGKEIPSDRIVTYQYGTGKKGIYLPVTVKIGSVQKWNPQPPKVVLNTLKKKKGGKLLAKWKKISRVSGYRIAYGTSASFKKSKTKYAVVKKAGTRSRVLKGLKTNKTYYVRVCAYRVFEGKTYYGPYSARKKARVTK